MKLSQFKFTLPKSKIALYPRGRQFDPNAEGDVDDYRRDRREESKLMVVHKSTGEIEDRIFADVKDYFGKDDVLVLNDTKVFPARLYGIKEKTKAKVEVFLLRELNSELLYWDVLVDPARKIRIGNKLYFGEDEAMVAEVIDNTTSRGRTLRFLYEGSHDDFKHDLYSLGEAPLPDDVRSQREADENDLYRFQTVYAKNEGAVTAPSTGLHFSRALMNQMSISGVNLAYITLHLGLGSFRQIDVEDLTKHRPDSEQLIVSKETCDIVNKAIDNGNKVCAVGISSMRALETAVITEHHISKFDAWTNKFIFPQYDFSVADSLIANFQMPQSPMFMLKCAFAGYDLMMKAYKKALAGDYLFGTYGDAMLITD